jgi:hypothetical protein
MLMLRAYRYFAVMGSTPYKRRNDSLPDDALIEWEELVLQGSASSLRSKVDSLEAIEKMLSSASFVKVCRPYSEDKVDH